jgi:hypothetical protein
MVERLAPHCLVRFNQDPEKAQKFEALRLHSGRCRIAQNAGAEGATVVQRCKAESNGIGYDAATATFVNLIDAGIIDPTKVIRSALQNAASVAGLLLTTEVLITAGP